MNEIVDLWETPVGKDNYMIAGWRQWADAGEISSGLPDYLVDLTDAKKIGEITYDGFYLFQIPGAHHLLRPHVRLVDGYREEVIGNRNEIFYADLGDKGLVIFLGDEPHRQEDEYARAFFEMAKALKVERIVAVGGVYGSTPYDRDREASCVYSLPDMKEELENYSVRFSNYEGGATIGTYLAHSAERYGMELVVLYAFAPAYEFSQLGITLQGMRVETDWKAWYDLMVRINYMFKLGLDLSELEEQSQELIEEWDERIEELEKEHPELHVKEYLDNVAEDFVEHPFIPLDDAWDELDNIDDLFTRGEDQE
ncbi:MAG: PAC2 family protein [Anaerolineae bacterium]